MCKWPNIILSFRRSSPPSCFSINQIIKLLLIKLIKNSGNMKKWWQIRELEGRKEEFGTNQLHDSLKMNPTITGKLKKYESLEAR